MLDSFIDKVKRGYWTRGNVWEWDWYIHILFAKTLSFAKYPVFFGYEQAILGDELLDFYKEKEITKRFDDFFESALKTKKILKDGENILASADKFISRLRREKSLNPKKYLEIQENLSQLMNFADFVSDEISLDKIKQISKEEGVSDKDITSYILKKSFRTKLRESNDKLLQLYKKYKNQIEKSEFGFDKLNYELKKRLIEHAQAYGWIATTEREIKPWTAEDFLNQIKSLIEKNKPKNINFGFIKDFSQNNKGLIEILIKINLFDNQAADKQVELDFLFKNYLKQKMGKYYIEPITQNLTFEELIEVSKNPKLIKKFEGRYNNQLRLVWPENGKLHFHYFKDKKDFDKIRYLIKSQASDIKEISGSVASRGRVEGIVRVIKTLNDLSDFKKGEILVAVQTQPAYVIAMTKAAAIVTDVGGITSHAAIISREFGIPCIVGTRNATSLLKNGDKVVVNAESGKVTKI